MPPKRSTAAPGSEISGDGASGAAAAAAAAAVAPPGPGPAGAPATGASASTSVPRSRIGLAMPSSRSGTPLASAVKGSGVSMGAARPPMAAAPVSMGTARPPSVLASSASGTPAAGASVGGGSGVGKMVFRPIMPQRRNRPSPSSAESSSTIHQAGSGPRSFAGRGAAFMRGAAGAGGRGRGRGRGAGGSFAPEPLHASGPFSQGPGGPPRSAAGASARLGISGGASSYPSVEDEGSRHSNASTSAAGPSGFKLDPNRFRDAKHDLDLADREALSDDDDVELGVRADGRMVAEDLEREDAYAPRALPKYRFAKAKEEGEQEAGRKKGRSKANGKGRIKEEAVEHGIKSVKKEPDADCDKTMGTAPADVKRCGETSQMPSAERDLEDDADAHDGKTDNALDLSESEDEELLDNLLDYFVANEDIGTEPEERLYLFQFPQPFPGFVIPRTTTVPPPADLSGSKSKRAGPGTVSDENDDDEKPRAAQLLKKRPSKGVVFAPDTAGGGGAAGVTPSPCTTPGPETSGDSASNLSSTVAGSSAGGSGVKKEDGDEKKPVTTKRKGPPEGRIGSLNLYRDGRVAFHLGRPAADRAAAAADSENANTRDNLVVLDVTGGSPATFLQQLMVLNPNAGTATSLGEIERKFVVTPDLDHVLADLSKRGL
ncbi:hypothetical protein K437DRAFT_253046 [Tilletiaria anomala UBC 951]|uniref:Uncharacterized protein n=1 Tax=Tilletiaria anomala (strain ATCC 24038 / CBS 436.72 / UBC 951) TaxID=1037660 RepID=A0A066WQU9_TILAU|nr:uncharacterized protein K437DRAFT_253046 [Tilletiaria anomala UBC 951]KDN53354.1 hypothetical protein K437DRAFT_253046 [Tilletiaria anomala UBC 951]